MNKKSIYFGGLLLAALVLGSCANDDTATDKTAGKDTPKSGTVFSSEEEPATRTSAKYTGSGLDFYWTASDKIWVKDDNGNYNQNASDDISSRIAAVPGSTTTDKAKFWVNGSYTGSTHKVRYTGKNGTKDKVTIKASQTQNTPNDAAHIADDGDFGVADATGSGKYSFTLNHKAAYVTFMPYTTQGVVSGAKIKKIRIYTNNTSDQLAGTFDLADNGVLSNGASTSNSVELNVNNFSIPSVSTYATNGATMVVKPGLYTNITIEYTLYDLVTNVTGVITKNYPSITFDAGKNTPVKSDLKVKEYPGNGYYQWDAQLNYWAGFEWGTANATQPSKNNTSNASDAPQSTLMTSAHTARDYNDVKGYNDATGTAPAVNPSHSAIGKVNVNELYWYVEKGDAHWDKTTLWATMGHLYVGGAWLTKQSVIASENSKTIQQLKDKAPDGIDYTRAHLSAYKLVSISEDKLNNLDDYIFLPALGSYNLGYLGGVGENAYFWSSTPVTSAWLGPIPQLATDNINVAYGLGVQKGYGIYVDRTNRCTGMRLWSTSNEDEYRPF